MENTPKDDPRRGIGRKLRDALEGKGGANVTYLEVQVNMTGEKGPYAKVTYFRE